MRKSIKLVWRLPKASLSLLKSFQRQRLKLSIRIALLEKLLSCSKRFDKSRVLREWASTWWFCLTGLCFRRRISLLTRFFSFSKKLITDQLMHLSPSSGFRQFVDLIDCFKPQSSNEIVRFQWNHSIERLVIRLHSKSYWNFQFEAI